MIEFVAVLIEADDAQLLGGNNFAGVGLQGAGEQAKERRLAGPILPEQTQPHAGREGQVQPGKKRAATQRFRDVLQHHQFVGLALRR